MQLTLRALRGDGWTAQAVEHWNPYAKVHQDLFGVLDVVALRGGVTLGVQATSSSNVASRVRKLEAAPTLAALREAGWQIEVWGWRKKDRRWIVRRVVLVGNDLLSRV